MMKVIVAAWIGLAAGWIGFGAMAAIGAAQNEGLQNVQHRHGLSAQASLFSGQ